MVNIKKDLTGMVFGRLKVLNRVDDYINPNGSRNARWLCECSCEDHNLVIVRGTHLTTKSHPTRSCGCLARENAYKTGKASKKEPIWLPDIFYDEHGEYRIGITHNTGNQFYVDVNDFDIVKDFCWTESVTKTGLHRPVTWIDGKCIPIFHLLGCKDWDHADRNEMNNRRSNLRPCTTVENRRNKSIQSNNTSGFIGISWREDRQKYRVYITVENKKQVFLGYFINKDDAIIARLKAEKEYFGEFAPQREMFEEYGI